MSFSIKRFLPHLLVFIGFVILSLAYFSPVLKGKEIFQSDIMHYIGMSKQQKDFKAQTGEETYWTNSAFGGMPTYQLGAKYPHNYIKSLDLAIRFLPRPADYLFLYLIGFYVLLLTLKVDFKLAALGALAFGFSTYLIIILGVGHNSKAHAIAYMPLVLSGILLTFRRKYIAGFLLTTVAMGLELVANHYQMTYYLMLLVLILGLAYLVDAYQKKELPHFFKAVGILLGAVILSIGLNATNILATQEYVKESTRGQSELTINADGSPKETSSGLDKSYITEYSYGKLEALNLFIPRIFGGGSHEDVGTDSEYYQFNLKRGATPLQAREIVKQAPTYWGIQPIVEAPAYVGAVILFLFVLGLFLVSGRVKWWLVGGTVLSLLLSFGKHFGLLTDFFIDFVPMYNKFRAVSSIQVILELCIPVLGILGLVELFKETVTNNDKLKALKYSVGITAGLAVLLLLTKSTLFDFVGGNDGYYAQNFGQDFIDAIRADRASMFTQDTLRTLLFVILAAAVVWMYLKQKLSETVVVVSLAILILFDLIGVDKRYVNNDDFRSSSQVNKPFQPNAADLQILKDTTHFRVFDVTSGAARASYFHNSLNGYHAAKLGRYNEVFDFYISKNNINVLNMLNTKYIIAQDEQGAYFPYENTDANGNAWFVNRVQTVENANQEIQELDSLNTKIVAVTTSNSIKYTKNVVDSTATINAIVYKPNYIKYKSNNNQNGFAVFSEIYYADGWNAYIDGNLVPHERVNYILRGLDIPAGTHSIEFKFEPKVIEKGSTIALASSVVFGLLLLIGLFFGFKKGLITKI
ncbi:YfhO family protein [Formosa sediminum]|uniref:YfhO family protein n=1 Tax=Formosa sediminum TaxID=2594004 RepID=A0A516GU50_9FLAO|nr:YfhO family protein [Formosa sediminum]QDO95051.1 YfhO family protein [Formosa sediminum]